MKAFIRVEMHFESLQVQTSSVRSFSALFHVEGSGKPKDESLEASSSFIHRKARGV